MGTPVLSSRDFELNAGKHGRALAATGSDRLFHTQQGLRENRMRTAEVEPHELSGGRSVLPAIVEADAMLLESPIGLFQF